MVNSTDFQYDLPEEAIAKHPVEPRRAARMVVVGRDRSRNHHTFEYLPELLKAGGADGLWANDTKVLHARILASKPTGGQLEIFLLAPAIGAVETALSARDSVQWKAMVRNAKRWSDGTATATGVHHELHISRLPDAEDGNRVVELTWRHAQGTQSTFAEVLEDLGKTPLPPYMRRSAEAQDKEDYQTVFAMTPGSVAAPTAGLHFDDVLLAELQEHGLPLSKVTLHVGAGTFKPLSEGEVMSHDMHAERCLLTRQALQSMAQQQVRIATGTTTLRTIESLFWWSLHWKVYGEWPEVLSQRSPYGELGKQAEALDWTDRDALSAILEHGPWKGQEHLSFETQLMIVPGYRIRMVQGLVTNFHQPGSTLLCLVGAFIGMSAWREMYEEALQKGYRFLSYGDGCLLWLSPQKAT